MIAIRNRRRPFAAAIACAMFAAAAGPGVWPVSVAIAQTADVKFDTLKVGVAPNEAELAGVEFVGSSLSRDEIMKLFAADTSVADRAALVAKLKATSFSIAAIKATSPKNAVVTINDIRATGVDSGKIARLAVAGGELKAPPGEAGGGRSGSLAFEELDLKALLASLQTGAMPVGAKAARVTWNGFEASVPDQDTPASAAGGNLIKISLAAFEAQSTYEGDVPVKSGGGLRNLVIELPKASAGGQQLGALGIEKLDIGMTFGVAYDVAKKALALDDFTLNAAGLGAIGLKAQLANVDPEALKGKPGESLIAMLGSELSSADLRLANVGVFQKVLAFVGQMQGKTPDALKAEWTEMAGAMLPMVIGDQQTGAQLAGAIGGFIRDAKSLTISIKGKNGPVKLSSINPGDPASLLAAVTITATNEGGPLAAAPAPAAPAPAAPQAAAPSPQAGLAPATPPAAGKLTGLAAINALVGNTISGKNSDGDPLFEYYLRNGSVKQLDDDEKNEGKWVARGQDICVEMDDDDEETCYRLEVTGNAATFTMKDGTVLRYTILQGNPKRL